MPESCTYFKVTQGPTESSTKEYYTTYFARVSVFCVDCNEPLGEQYEDSGHEKAYVDDLIKEHRKPLITVEWNRVDK